MIIEKFEKNKPLDLNPKLVELEVQDEYHPFDEFFKCFVECKDKEFLSYELRKSTFKNMINCDSRFGEMGDFFRNSFIIEMEYSFENNQRFAKETNTDFRPPSFLQMWGNVSSLILCGNFNDQLKEEDIILFKAYLPVYQKYARSIAQFGLNKPIN